MCKIRYKLFCALINLIRNKSDNFQEIIDKQKKIVDYGDNNKKKEIMEKNITIVQRDC